MPNKRRSKASKATESAPETARYEVSREPYIHYNSFTNTLMITAHPAYLRVGEKYVTSKDGSYISRSTQPDRIIHALQKVTDTNKDGPDLWPLIQAGDPEALLEVRRAIKESYDPDFDLSDRQPDTLVRKCAPFIICTPEQNRSTVPHSEIGLFTSAYSNSANSEKLPTSQITVRPSKTGDKSRIARIKLVIDHTFATKHTEDNDINVGETRAMTTDAVDQFARHFVRALPCIGSHLWSLMNSSPRIGTNYKPRHAKTKQQVESLTSALSKQHVESVLKSSDIDHNRVEGSDPTYTANPVFTRKVGDPAPIEVNVIADFSRITGSGSIGEAEEESEI